MAELPADTVQQAMQLHREGRFDEARAMYEQALAADPENPDALHLLGVLQAQQGQLQHAYALVERAVALRPAEAMFHNNLGNVAAELGRLQEAETHYLHAFELDRERVDALNNLGVVLGRQGNFDGAERVLRRVVELAPGFRDAHQNLAAIHLRQGRYQDAVNTCIDGLVTQPRSNHLRRLLGAAYGMLGMKEEAIETYRGWLESEPDHPVALHHLHALTGEAVPDRAPNAYVRTVFDAFASSFDAKLADLGYQAPQAVADALARLAGPPAGTLAVLDAGCGTGLVGPLVAPFAQRLVGVDLSKGMLQGAAARGVYDELYAGELVAFLDREADAWDVVLSADTLCYFGRLDAFAAAALRALRPGGRLVFTVERLDGAVGDDPFRLNHHGRYAHRRAYVEQVLTQAGLQAVAAEATVLRQEAGQPVHGWLVSAARAAAN